MLGHRAAFAGDMVRPPVLHIIENNNIIMHFYTQTLINFSYFEIENLVEKTSKTMIKTSDSDDRDNEDRSSSQSWILTVKKLYNSLARVVDSSLPNSSNSSPS